jgi:hypothetical protein
MLEWITAAKKQKAIEVIFLDSDSTQQNAVACIPYSHLVKSTLADYSSAGAVILRFRDQSLALLVRSEVRRDLEKLIHSRRIKSVSGSRDRDIILEELESKDRQHREALHCSFIDRIRTVVTQQEVQRDLEGAREQIKRMRFQLEILRSSHVSIID